MEEKMKKAEKLKGPLFRESQPYILANPPQELSGHGVIQQTENVGALSSIAREEGEIKASVMMAKMYPRDELGAYNGLMRACERPTFADQAVYAFPRGKAMVEGPSVNLAKAAAQKWGSIAMAIQVLSDDDERVHIRGVARDAETNTTFSFEDKFKKLIYRSGSWIKPDERDLRELINRRGAICVRNAILSLIPSDVIEDAVTRCKETTRSAAAGEIKQDRQKTLRAIVAAFEQLGVSGEMIELYLGHDIMTINEEEVATLRGIRKSISDGNSKREEYFSLPKPKGVATAKIDPSKITEKVEDREPGQEG